MVKDGKTGNHPACSDHSCSQNLCIIAKTSQGTRIAGITSTPAWMHHSCFPSGTFRYISAPAHQKETPCIGADVQSSAYPWARQKRAWQRLGVVAAYVAIYPKLSSLSDGVLVFAFVFGATLRQRFDSNRGDNLAGERRH